MPRWLSHARNLVGARRRWGITSPLGEVYSGVLPVVQVYKHRDARDQDIFGMFVQITGDAVNIPACALVAQADEVLIHRIEFFWSQIRTLSRPVHLFTPLQNYNPFDVALPVPPAAHFAWWQGKAVAQDVGQLGGTFGVGGYGTAHQVINVNGVPTVTFGPTYDWEFWLGGAFGTAQQPARVIWTFQDPPFRLKPFTMACVQSVFAGMGAAEHLNVNFFYSERPSQGDVG